MSSIAFEDSCTNCLSKEYLSPITLEDCNKLRTLTNLSFEMNESNPQKICAECRTLANLLFIQIETIDIAFDTLYGCLVKFYKGTA